MPVVIVQIVVMLSVIEVNVNLLSVVARLQHNKRNAVTED
jgi:hypothetical protein